MSCAYLPFFLAHTFIFAAHRLGGRNKPKGVRVALGMVTAAVALTDVLVVVLGLSAFWSVTSL